MTEIEYKPSLPFPQGDFRMRHEEEKVPISVRIIGWGLKILKIIVGILAGVLVLYIGPITFTTVRSDAARSKDEKANLTQTLVVLILCAALSTGLFYVIIKMEKTHNLGNPIPSWVIFGLAIFSIVVNLVCSFLRGPEYLLFVILGINGTVVSGLSAVYLRDKQRSTDAEPLIKNKSSFQYDSDTEEDHSRESDKATPIHSPV